MEPSCVNWVRLNIQYSMLLHEVVSVLVNRSNRLKLCLEKIQITYSYIY